MSQIIPHIPHVSDKAAYAVAGGTTATGLSAFFDALPPIIGLIGTIAAVALTIITIWYKIKAEEQASWLRMLDEERKKALFELDKQERADRISAMQRNRRAGDCNADDFDVNYQYDVRTDSMCCLIVYSDKERFLGYGATNSAALAAALDNAKMGGKNVTNNYGLEKCN